jgi:ribosomal protein S18 acetylase RimI-like enzyme
VFTTATLARRIERAETGLIIEGVRTAARRLPPGQMILHEMNGGAVTYVEPGAPFNKAVGFGFDGVPADDVLDAVERSFAERSAPLQFEVSTLGDPAILRALSRRGYELVGFENVLGLALSPASAFATVPGVEVTRATDDEAQQWLDVVALGFMSPDTFDGPPSHEAVIPRDVLDRIFGDTIAAPGFERYLARRHGRLAGGASLRLQDGVAQLSGAATLPAHRRQGVQSALLRHRLTAAASRGCDIAVVTTQPGSKSQENVQKAGFALLYPRAILTRSVGP